MGKEERRLRRKRTELVCNFDLLENALFSTSCDSALCNLLLFYLDSIFKCYDEETFDDEETQKAWAGDGGGGVESDDEAAGDFDNIDEETNDENQSENENESERG